MRKCKELLCTADSNKLFWKVFWVDAFMWEAVTSDICCQTTKFTFLKTSISDYCFPIDFLTQPMNSMLLGGCPSDLQCQGFSWELEGNLWRDCCCFKWHYDLEHDKRGHKVSELIFISFYILLTLWTSWASFVIIHVNDDLWLSRLPSWSFNKLIFLISVFSCLQFSHIQKCWLPSNQTKLTV